MERLGEGSQAHGHGTDGGRLALQERRLRLLLAHLAGHAVRRRVELEDLLQEVFLRVLASPRGLPAPTPDEGPLWGLLALEARHVVIDVARALRAQKRSAAEVPLQRSDWSRAPAAAGPGPRTQAIAGESARTLERAFLELSPDQRRVLGLRQFEGLTAEEAGRRLGRSTVAVHSLYRRALEAWERKLSEKRISRDESRLDPRLGAP